MVNGIKCPECGSEKIATVLYGMPAFDEDLSAQLEAGNVVLNGCRITMDEPLYPYECQACGLRFDEEAGKHLSAKEFFSEADFAWMQHIASYLDYCDGEGGVDCGSVVDDAGRGAAGSAESDFDRAFLANGEDYVYTCADLACCILQNDPVCFELALEDDEGKTYRNFSRPEFARLVKMGLEYGVACGDGACANYLGALYYMGDVVEQDYDKAKELYEIAEHKGVENAVLNLGYIYEYGRTGESDYQKAFNQYAKAAVLTRNFEGLYKMGDMYSRAKVVERDLRAAYLLYEESLMAAGANPVARAQPAIRIANLISDRANAEWGIPYDPMRALELYQLAERGLRVDIAHGQTYYKKRLQEALDGQARMRELLDNPAFRL